SGSDVTGPGRGCPGDGRGQWRGPVQVTPEEMRREARGRARKTDVALKRGWGDGHGPGRRGVVAARRRRVRSEPDERMTSFRIPVDVQGLHTEGGERSRAYGRRPTVRISGSSSRSTPARPPGRSTRVAVARRTAGGHRNSRPPDGGKFAATIASNSSATRSGSASTTGPAMHEVAMAVLLREPGRAGAAGPPPHDGESGVDLLLLVVGV